MTHAKDFQELRPFIDAMTEPEKAKLGSGNLDGGKLWRKWKLISGKITNEAGPIWAKLVGKDNEPPTGTNVAEMLLKVRKALWDIAAKMAKEAEEARAANEGKLIVIEDMKYNWYPPYWLAFIHYGPCAGDRAIDIFSAQLSNGPPRRSNPDMTIQQQRQLFTGAEEGEPLSRVSFRKTANTFRSRGALR